MTLEPMALHPLDMQQYLPRSSLVFDSSDGPVPSRTEDATLLLCTIGAKAMATHWIISTAHNGPPPDSRISSLSAPPQKSIFWPVLSAPVLRGHLDWLWGQWLEQGNPLCLGKRTRMTALAPTRSRDLRLLRFVETYSVYRKRVE
ncbi:hypothetical protein N7470_010208 [Penicillium chermesinum]|nr:hypothetical protein N7470_010208 [Penicillium chermesinum]